MQSPNKDSNSGILQKNLNMILPEPDLSDDSQIHQK